MADLLSNAALTWAATGQKPNMNSTTSRSSNGNIKVLKQTKEMKAQLERRKGGSLTQPREI